MPLVRKFAVQGHVVPKSAYRAHGPFSPEILAQNPVSYNQEHSDSLHEALDDVRMFRCRYCADVLYEDELNSHYCEDEETEEE